MPAHWTYDDFQPNEDLDQGDILQPNSELRALLAEVHPHFCDEKYLGFLVASQSCDLVRRKGKVKARYINIAVVRPLDQVSKKLISYVVRPVAAGRFPRSGKFEAERLLERVFNQNEQAIGLFFLHQDADVGIGQDAVAMLRVTVSVKSEHYETLTGARTGRLKAEFQAKLGWLLGNLFNRPASPDWGDIPGGEKKLKDLISQYTENDEELMQQLGVCWIDDVLIREAQSKRIELATASLAELEGLRPKAPLDQALDEIRASWQRWRQW